MQSQHVRDARHALLKLNVEVVWISPDKAAAQQKFDAKYSLGFPLLADTEHEAAEAYGAWGKKSLYGREYFGIIRSSFLVDEKGKIQRAWYKISPDATVPEALNALKS